MNTMVSILLVGLISVSYVLQNWILSFMEEAPNEWVVFGSLAVIGGLVPFLLFIWGVLLLIRRSER